MEIQLVDGSVEQVSAEIYDLVRHFRWHRCGFCGHIYRTVRRSREGDYTIYLAAEVLGDEKLPVAGACNPCPAIRD